MSNIVFVTFTLPGIPSANLIISFPHEFPDTLQHLFFLIK